MLSHGTLNRVFRLLNPKAFATVFSEWVGEVLPTLGHVAIDGKSLRGARREGTNPIHLASTFAMEARLTLVQHQIGNKGREVEGAKALLEALELGGCLVSIDAVGCQTDLAKQIRRRGADYRLGVKGNQPNLRRALEDGLADATDAGAFEQIERGHGRCTARRAEVITNTNPVDAELWPEATRRRRSKPVTTDQFGCAYIRATGDRSAPALGRPVTRNAHRAGVLRPQAILARQERVLPEVKAWRAARGLD